MGMYSSPTFNGESFIASYHFSVLTAILFIYRAKKEKQGRALLPMLSYLTTLFLVSLALTGIAECHNISDIRALRKHLFENTGYDRRMRPAVNQSEPTEVGGYYLYSVLAVTF